MLRSNVMEGKRRHMHSLDAFDVHSIVVCISNDLTHTNELAEFLITSAYFGAMCRSATAALPHISRIKPITPNLCVHI